MELQYKQIHPTPNSFQAKINAQEMCKSHLQSPRLNHHKITRKLTRIRRIAHLLVSSKDAINDALYILSPRKLAVQFVEQL